MRIDLVKALFHTRIEYRTTVSTESDRVDLAVHSRGCKQQIYYIYPAVFNT